MKERKEAGARTERRRARRETPATRLWHVLWPFTCHYPGLAQSSSHGTSTVLRQQTYVPVRLPPRWLPHSLPDSTTHPAIMAEQRDGAQDPSPSTRTPSERHAPETRRPLMQRALERTVDKLGRKSSIGNKSQMSQSQPDLPVQSLSRLSALRSRVKGKERASPTDDGSAEGEPPVHDVTLICLLTRP